MWMHSKMPKRDNEDVSRASGKNALFFMQVYFTIFFEKIYLLAYMFFAKYAFWHTYKSYLMHFNCKVK